MKRLLLILVLLTTSLCAVSLDDLRFLLDKEQFAITSRILSVGILKVSIRGAPPTVVTLPTYWSFRRLM